MITIYRPANYNNPRAPEFTGRSIDTKPTNVENGASYKEIDTGRIYRYDKENNRWIEWEGTPVAPSITVEPITITENGVTTAPEGKAYSPITVNVPASGVTEPYIEETYDNNGYLIDAKMHGYTKLRDYMFYRCIKLASTSLPENLTSIGNSAFSDCSKLALISLPNHLTSIGSSAFSGCSKLSLTSLPESITKIGSSAFYECSNLALISLPENLTVIDDSTFILCEKLALTSLPKNLVRVGDNAFYSCTGLNQITFRSTVTSISTSAFSGCSNLTVINAPWAEGAVAGAPWGATNATINYNYTGE